MATVPEPYFTDGQVTLCSCCGAAPTDSGLRRGWCRPCYLRWFKAGKPEAGPPAILNDKLDRWRELAIAEVAAEPTDLAVGIAGEHLVCADLLLAGYTAFLADQNCAYDIAVDLGGRLVRLQVKSTRQARPIQGRNVNAYQYHVRRAGNGGRRKYVPDAFDLLALVALDIRRVAYLPPSVSITLIQLRPPGAGPVGKQFDDYPFGRAVTWLGSTS